MYYNAFVTINPLFMLYLLLACFVVMLASLSGVFFLTNKLSGWTERNLRFLISFSAGVFIVVAYHLTIESIEHTSTAKSVMWLLIGAIAIHIFSKIWPEFHHHHERDVEHIHSVAGARRILMSDALHNIGDGVLLAAAFAVNIYLGIVATASIFIHEAIQEISEFFVLKEAGYSNREALVKNFFVSSTIIIGALIGYFVSEQDYIMGPLLGFAAGAFIYILINDLIPKSIKNAREGGLIKHLGWTVLGLVIILAVNTFLGHEEIEEAPAGADASVELSTDVSSE